jgi:uncharacterized metal-binding protein YceD (DUF177 family)
MKLHLPSYPRGQHRISETLESVQLDLDCSLFPREIEAQIQFDRQDPYLRLDCQLKTWIHRICDRCLADYDNPITADARLVFVLGAMLSHPSEVADEIQYIPADSQEIDLSADLRDILMLSLPMKSLCRDDCRGLCSHCGQDLNEGLCLCSG